MTQSADGSTLNALTFDVEDWYHGLCASPQEWGGHEDRLRVGLDTLLAILDWAGAKATFFVLAPLARSHPELIREIARMGHEIGSHGCTHQPIYRQTEQQFKRDVCNSRRVIEDTIGGPVYGYRAPFFSVTRRTPWAADAIRQAGYQYDSSIFPVYNPRYGMPCASRLPHCLPNGLIEFPISTLRVGGMNLPFSGGIYARFLGAKLVRWATSRLNRQGSPAMIYFHPWEFDPGHPHITFKHLSPLYHLTHYHNLKGTGGILRQVLCAYRFGPAQEVLAQADLRAAE